mmetsp:Transcript_17880/g.27625  ORF Transcript_17880/g.27625 Transcript_17880/m.27625 type:complete len:616 (-) Transcript_17880:97-1944(-)
MVSVASSNRYHVAFALVIYIQCLNSGTAFLQTPSRNHVVAGVPNVQSSLSTIRARTFSPMAMRNKHNVIPRETFQQRSTRIHMVSYEDLLEKIPSKAVIDAVEASPGGKVIASDVAATAGVSLSQARKDLTALASLSQGDIAVSSEGELIYTFPQNLNSALSSNSAKYKALATFEKNIWPKLFYGIRVGFGVVLLASLFAIFSTIFFISQGSSSDDDRRRDNRGGGGGLFGGGSYIWGPSPFDFFYYRPYYGYYGSSYGGAPERDPEDMGFLESTFSYIFGDGNPNQGLDEKRLSIVANLIRENNGAVTAEQLAPFCDDAPVPDLNSDSAYVDESFVLPIVTALDGEPTVTEDGDIVYLFPELQTSASSSKRLSSSSSASGTMSLKRVGLSSDASARDIKFILDRSGVNTRGALEKKDLLAILEDALPPMTKDEEKEMMLDDPTMLQEREYKFTLASGFQKFAAGGLGVVNLLGALYLGNMFSSAAMYGVRLPSYFGLVQSAYPFLLGYAILFNVIPVARNFWINGQNGKIRQRNKIRRMWKTVLEGSGGKIAKKLKAASKMGTSMKQLGASKNDIVFDTKKSTMEELEKKKETDALKEFDKLLEKDGDDASSFQ